MREALRIVTQPEGSMYRATDASGGIALADAARIRAGLRPAMRIHDRSVSEAGAFVSGAAGWLALKPFRFKGFSGVSLPLR